MKKLVVFVIAIVTSISVQGQTLDEILSNYFENIGGKEKLASVKGIKMTASINQMGMTIPLEIYNFADGKQMTVVSFQGKSFKSGVFDGETLWSTNFMTMKAEKSDAEATANFKLSIGDFPDSFLDYKKKGYKAELLGKETIDGTETFKIKLTKKPITVDGKKEENIEFHFFDTENFVPIAIHTEIKSGQAKGMMSVVSMSDYDEVDGIYFPFSMTQGVKGQPGQPITISKIELNPTVDAKEFTYPEEEKKEEEKKEKQ